MKIKLNATGIKQAKPDQKTVIYWDTDLKGYGLRVTPAGSKTLFIQDKIKVGRRWEVIKKTILRTDDPNFNAESARKEARKWLGKIAAGEDIREAQADQNTANTFGDLMTAYVTDLEAEGKPSAKAVGNAIAKDIEKAFPRLWRKPAKSISIDDCVSIIGRLSDEDKARQADKMRSYIKAAFTRAINARGNAKASKVMRELRLTSNPARDITKLEGSSEAKTRALSLAEFQCYWRRIQQLPEPRRSLAMLHVITGGQRQQQLARVTLADIDRDGMTMTMLDGKGRRKKPRVHVVPLLPLTLELIDNITGGGEFVFSANGGTSPIDTAYLTRIASKVCSDMAEAGELEGVPFTAGTIRATIETRLMNRPYRVSSDVLARLLSHGLGGVQAKHYAHDSMHDEQVEALEKLQRMIEGEPEPSADVLQFVRRASA